MADEQTPWLATLYLEVQGIDDDKLIPPKPEVEDKEVVLGVVNGFSRKLYTQWQLYGREISETMIKVRYDGNITNHERELVERHISRLHSRIEVLKEMFWLQCREEIGCWDKDSVGIREGWQLVDCSHSHPQPPEFLKRLFGDMP